MMYQPKFWNLTRAPDGKEAELRITGDIVGEGDAGFYEWFEMPHTTPGGVRAQLHALGGAPLTVWIDSYGGDVNAAASIYTALMEYTGAVTVKIEGAAYSAASVIAMAGEKVYMSPLATMMIHMAWTSAQDNASGLRHTANILDEVDEALINAYTLKTGRTRGEIRALLEADDRRGTWMSAARAIELGFADGMLYAPDSREAQEKIVARAMAVYARTKPPEKPPDPEATDIWDTEAARLTLERLRY